MNLYSNIRIVGVGVEFVDEILVVDTSDKKISPCKTSSSSEEPFTYNFFATTLGPEPVTREQYPRPSPIRVCSLDRLFHCTLPAPRH